MSIYFVKELLIEMGMEAIKAKNIIERFKEHDELMMLEQYKVRHDDKTMVSLSKQSVAQLAQVLNDESQRTYVAPAIRSSRTGRKQSNDQLGKLIVLVIRCKAYAHGEMSEWPEGA
ncbi:MAG: hypothetical protein R2877_01030 [Bdellovibrionota bacterium]